MRYEELVAIHADETRKRFGDHASINFGWVIDEDDYTICTKVYDTGEVICTHLDENGEVKTEVEPY